MKSLDDPNDRSESLPYLDDAYCRKVFPLLEQNASPRDIATCPIQVLENIPAGYWPDQSIKNIEIDFTKLEPILSSVPNTEACVILTKDWLGKNLKSNTERYFYQSFKSECRREEEYDHIINFSAGARILHSGELKHGPPQKTSLPQMPLVLYETT